MVVTIWIDGTHREKKGPEKYQIGKTMTIPSSLRESLYSPGCIPPGGIAARLGRTATPNALFLSTYRETPILLIARHDILNSSSGRSVMVRQRRICAVCKRSERGGLWIDCRWRDLIILPEKPDPPFQSFRNSSSRRQPELARTAYWLDSILRIIDGNP
jgi:hypothetical protein